MADGVIELKEYMQDVLPKKKSDCLEKEEIERYINVAKFIAPYETSIDYIIDKNLLTYESCIDFIRRCAANLYRFSDKN